MGFADLQRHLSRIEAGRGATVPTRIMADRPMDEAEATTALVYWCALVSDGRASVSNGVLCIQAPEMTMEAWEARFVTED